MDKMDKMEIAIEIGKLEGELAKMEGESRDINRQYSSAKGNRTAGATVLLIGIIGVLFLSSLWLLWLFLGMIGMLTLFTAIGNQNKAQESIQINDEQIADIRTKLGEKRAILITL